MNISQNLFILEIWNFIFFLKKKILILKGWIFDFGFFFLKFEFLIFEEIL